MVIFLIFLLIAASAASAFDVQLFPQPSGSNKTELHKFLRSNVTSVMDSVGFPKECLVSDATAAALRNCLGRSNNTLVCLADKYRSTLASLKIGQVGFSFF